jgi:hypothetical protein
MLFLDIAFRSERDVLATEFPHLGFELLLLRLSNAQGLLSVEALESGEAPASRPASLPAERPAAVPAATFSRKPPPRVEARVSSIAAPAAGKTADVSADLSAEAAGAAKAEAAGAAKGAPSKGDAGLWDAVRRNLEGKKKTVLLGLLSQMRGELREGEFVITCGHEMMLDRLKEKDKWQPLLASLEEAAGRAVPVRLSVSTEKKSPEPDAVAPGDAGLERKALEEPTVLEILRTFEGSMLVKVQHAPPVEVPRNGIAADEDPGEPEIPEAEAE